MPVLPDVRVMLVGLREAVTREGETDAARPTVPAKPLRLLRVTADVLASPVMIVRLDGDEIVKSVTLVIT